MADAPIRWLPVPGWEGYYSVSDQGQVRSEPRVISRRGQPPQRVSGRILKRAIRQGRVNYAFVVLCRNATPENKYVHTLVLEAFVGPRPPDMECRHLDGNSLNCRLGNLEWGTTTENTADRERHGTLLRGEAAPWSRLTEEQVRRIKADKRYQRVIAADYSVSQTTISKIKLGKSWAQVPVEVVST